eukprot:c25395_g1_i3 orf=372-1292(+)
MPARITLLARCYLRRQYCYSQRGLYPVRQYRGKTQPVWTEKGVLEDLETGTGIWSLPCRAWTTGLRGFSSLCVRQRFAQVMALSSVESFAASRMWMLNVGGAGNRYYSRGWGLFPSEKIVWGLIGANTFVFFLWQVSIDSILSGRLHTLVTAGFSHEDPYHLFSNMLGLYFFGYEIGSLFGGKYLVMLYFAGCVGGALGHIAYHAYVAPRLQNIPREFFNPRYTQGAYGASGAVTAITILDILLFPKRTILLYFAIPVPAAVLGALIIGSDLWRAKQGDSAISGSSHLGGALVGLLAWLYHLKRLR